MRTDCKHSRITSKPETDPLLQGTEALCGLGACGRLAESVMATTTYLETDTIRDTSRADTLRFSLLVRVTHWLNTISFVALVISGFGILLAHPRFYWGETGGVGRASLFGFAVPVFV